MMRVATAHRVLLAAALLAPVLAGCRQDMHNQAKYKPFARNAFFADQRASRPLVAGVVARGRLDVKDHRASFRPARGQGGGRPERTRDRRAMPRWRSEGSGDGKSSFGLAGQVGTQVAQPGRMVN
jgi:hypothetical protein